ncbi:MAG: hypothetical protein P8Q48_22930 [Paracoccaceae bacterium]|nr:hypothetical protein [Paracoccaceae bacterium]
MFSPEGYLRFGVIAEIAREISRDLAWAYRSQKDAETVLISQQPGERDALECWLIAQFFQNVDPIIVSAKGVVLSASWSLLTHADNIEILPAPIPIEESTLLPEGFDSNIDPYYFLSRFIYVDALMGTIRTTEDMQSFTPDPDVFDQPMGLLTHRNFARRLDVLHQYENWSICVKEDSLPDEEDALFELFGVGNELLSKVNEGSLVPAKPRKSSKRGRPRIREHVEDAYWSLFPSGHEAKGVTLGSATNAVSEALGQIISDDTLRRALGKKS